MAAVNRPYEVRERSLFQRSICCCSLSSRQETPVRRPSSNDSRPSTEENITNIFPCIRCIYHLLHVNISVLNDTIGALLQRSVWMKDTPGTGKGAETGWAITHPGKNYGGHYPTWAHARTIGPLRAFAVGAFPSRRLLWASSAIMYNLAGNS